LQVVDYFAPANEGSWSDGDRDLGNVGPVLIPGANLTFAGGTKYGEGHLVDTNNLGGFNATTDACLQSITSGFSSSVGQNPVIWDAGTDGVFIYVWGSGSSISQFTLNVELQQIAPSAPSSSFSNTAGGGLGVSSDGTSEGILWAIGNNAVLYALNASDISQPELWDSNMVSRDNFDSVPHWPFPTIVNGKVYVPTGDATIEVYGLLSNDTPAQVAFTSKIANVDVSVEMLSPFSVAIQDANGVLIGTSTLSVTISLGEGASADVTLGGTLTVAAQDGVVQFTDISLNQIGTYTLVASSAGLTSATSNEFQVVSQSNNGGETSGAFSLVAARVSPVLLVSQVLALLLL